MRIGFVSGVGKKTTEAPGHNLTGDSFYADGVRAVLEFDKMPNNVETIDFFDWASPTKSVVLPD